MTTEERKALVAKLEGADVELVLMTQNDRVVLDREVLKALILALKK
jgi:hypothetical protein